jgi:hypothetical protein
MGRASAIDMALGNLLSDAFADLTDSEVLKVLAIHAGWLLSKADPSADAAAIEAFISCMQGYANNFRSDPEDDEALN